MADVSEEVKVAPDHSANGHAESRSTTEFREAIENRWVTLDHLIEALAKRRASQDAERKALYDRDFCQMRDVYNTEGNRIEESYFCQNLEGGALLTRHETPRRRCRTAAEETKHRRRRWFRNRTRRWGCTTTYRIHVRYPTQAVGAVTPEFANALWRCMSLSKRATQLLRTQNSIAIHKSMYSVIVYLLSVLDTVAASPPASPDGARPEAEKTGAGDEKPGPGMKETTPKDRRVKIAIDDAQERLDHAVRQFDACTRWGSNFAYFNGMLFGLVVLALAGLTALQAIGDTADVEMFLAVTSAGGAGAMVSAMSRMGSDAFYLDPLAEHRGVALLGAFRPLIGAVFGAAAFLVVEGGLLDVVPASVGDAEPTRTFFFAALGFLAGFNERFATGVLSRAGAGAGDSGQHLQERSGASTGAGAHPPAG
jgi:hypothetical protein